MERNTIPAKKQYDLSAIDELFKDCISPEELRIPDYLRDDVLNPSN